jgi:hypothetical protein
MRGKITNKEDQGVNNIVVRWFKCYEKNEGYRLLQGAGDQGNMSDQGTF